MYLQLRLLMERSEFWLPLSRESYSVGFRALAFRLIARAGSLVFELLDRPHQQFPARLFKLLDSSGSGSIYE